MKGLMSTMMLSCKKATELVEKKAVVELAFAENIQLKMHLMVCSACKKYKNQSKIIDLVLEQINKKNEGKLGLSQDVETKIILEIENN